MPEKLRFKPDAAEVLSAMVDEMADLIHAAGLSGPSDPVFRHQNARWQDCTHPWCISARVKAISTLLPDEDDEPEQAALTGHQPYEKDPALERSHAFRDMALFVSWRVPDRLTMALSSLPKEHVAGIAQAFRRKSLQKALSDVVYVSIMEEVVTMILKERGIR